MTGIKHDDGKPRMDLISGHAMAGLGRVLAVGAKKYGDNNWRKGMKWSRPAAALLRHFFAWLGGEENDPETGLPHIDCVLANATFLSEYSKTGVGEDDRWRGISQEPPLRLTERLVEHAKKPRKHTWSTNRPIFPDHLVLEELREPRTISELASALGMTRMWASMKIRKLRANPNITIVEERCQRSGRNGPSSVVRYTWKPNGG